MELETANSPYTQDYTLGLALFDLIPVTLSAVGLCLLARWMQGRFSLSHPAWIGAVMSIAGGVSKAVWKIIVVTTGQDIVIMNLALFPLLGGGFAILLLSVILLKFGKDAAIWPSAMIVLALCYAGAIYLAMTGENMEWNTAMLGLTVVASSILYIWLAGMAVARSSYLPGLLIIATLGGAFFLTRLARIPAQTLQVQWTAEIVNTGAQLAFLIGIYLLTQKTFRLASKS